MTAPVVLALNRVRVRYGATLAVDGVTLDVHRGEIVGLLGPNGSGKSSTLAAAGGVIDPVEGTVAIGGVGRDRDPARFAARVGLVPQEPALYDELSADANLAFFGRLYGLRGCVLGARVERALRVARLTDRRHDRVGTFSGGMKQRLNLVAALLHDPPVLLLDEPTASLDPASRDALFGTLHDLRESGHAILLSTHHLDEAEHGCDRIAVLEKGRLVACGRPADLIRNQPSGRAVLYAHLRDALPKFFQKSLRRRVGPGVEVEITGRRLRLAAATQEELGRALAVVLSDGIVLDTFRTPPGRLEHLLRGHQNAPHSESHVPS
ncbi:ABC transporter ATP-binding protein [Fimbriiglobus ruber]|uniref:Daunorubicin resistance ABC transporter, ATP-binding protein n=1 Tax=Fimbriiglobus ruber TaxID=1908690 RepID=A0A225EBD5_9BACT|nr:ABC transporter ATP-binding protein [Fimbriiglobus ruber]OWK45697.1 Daunorubicin resistance ABC transporter, ATP-binding protein [Fimbriiglobus ruber]